ncbi:MAG: ABC transporter ATP-binding protein/permease [Alcaligenaceae bacterium]|nr:ABC transporter ATP-binding protein/permease [Alcaligenaceae bacterium]
MLKFFHSLWFLFRVCVSGPQGRWGLAQLTLIIAFSLGNLYVSILFIDWNADFYNALQEIDGPEIVRQVLVFVLLTAVSVGLFLAGRYLKRLLEMRWRQQLTEYVLTQWLEESRHWFLKLKADQQWLDNPDQRIAEDCRIFVQRFLSEGVALLIAIVSVVSYVVVLWNLSTFPLSFSVFGLAVEIDRYMVWAAPLYVLLSSSMTHFLGAPLKTLSVKQQRKEADFRFALTHFRENSETIALARGEGFEKQVLRDRFRAIIDNWYALTRRDFVLGCFTRPYFQTVLRVPMFLALPAFIAQKVTLGGLMQLASAFSRVVNTLSWFIFNYHSLVELGAATTRLGQFVDALQTIEAREPEALKISESPDNQLVLSDVRIDSPGGQTLMRIPQLVLPAGEHLWLRGASGIGKSTLFRTIAGLWPYAYGEIQRSGNCVFVGQQGYFPLGSMQAALGYAATGATDGSAPSEAEQLQVLENICPDLLEKVPALGETTDLTPYYKKLSGGQRQQLILARLLFQSADWVFLDEATSAMDTEREFQILKKLQEALPHATFVFLAHRAPNVPFSYRTIDLEAFVPVAG